MYYPPTGFWDHHGGWTQIRDEAAGGILGSAPIQAVTAGKSITTLGDKIVNRDILKKSKTQEGKRFGVKKDKDKNGNTVYRVVGYETSKEDGKDTADRVEIDLNTLKDADGESLQTEFSKFDEAFEVSRAYTKQDALTSNTITAWRYKNIRNGESKIIENEDGTFSVEIYDNNGELFKKDEEIYNKKWKANRRKKQLDNTIEDINSMYTKYKLDNVEDNEIIQKFEKDQKIEIIEKISEEMSSNNNIGLGISAFMLDKLDIADNDTQEQFNIMLDEVFESPDNIIDLIKQDTDNEILRSKGHTPEQILSSFDMTFGPDGENISNFTSKRKELNKALYPESPPKNQNKGPEVSKKPELVIVPPDVGPDLVDITGPPDITEPDITGPPEKGPSVSRKVSPKLSKQDIKVIKTNITNLKKEISTLEEGTSKRQLYGTIREIL